MTPQKRGPKSKRSPLDEENQKLRRENQHLSEELRKAEIVIDIQKKVAALLGRPICTPQLPLCHFGCLQPVCGWLDGGASRANPQRIKLSKFCVGVSQSY